MSKWNRLGEIDLALGTIKHLDSSDICWYAHDFIGGAGFRGGAVNSNILNFKKKPKDSWQHYRTQSIHKFALDSSGLFDCSGNNSYFVTAIPSSKAKNDPEYDNRFEDFFNQLQKYCPCVNVTWPITVINSTEASHRMSGARNPEAIMKNYQFNGFGGLKPTNLVVFDDVLTSGAHFRAYKDFLIKNGFQGKVFGVFWAKTK